MRDSAGDCVTQYANCSEILGSNSTYNSVSGSCECNSGYGIGPTSGKCVTPNSFCSEGMANTHWTETLGTDGKYICDCNAGYVWNSQRTACTIAPILTNDQKCNQKYNNSYSVIDPTTGLNTCNCIAGYYWDNNASGQPGNCFTSAQLDQGCSNHYPNTYWDRKYTTSGLNECDCISGYTWNYARTACY